MDLSNDNDPKFTAQFFGNIKILSQDLFHTSASNKKSKENLFSSMLNKNDCPKNMGSEKGMLSNEVKSFDKSSRKANIAREESINDTKTKKEANLIQIEKKSEKFEKKKELDKEIIKEKDYFSLESIHDRLRIYAKEGGVPLDLVDRYSEHRNMEYEKGLAGKEIGE